MGDIFKLYFGWILYDLLCLSLFLIVGLHKKFKRNQLIVLFSLVGCGLAVWGNAITMDYRAYWKIIQQIVYGSHKHIHLEALYIYIVNYIGANYSLFQAIIYVPAYIIFICIIHKLKVRKITVFLLVFAVVCLYYECIGSRQFLFVVTFNLALLYLAQKKYVTFLILICLSTLFHKMAYMAIPLLVLFFIPLKGNLFKISCVIIITAIISKVFLSNIIDILLILYGHTEGVSYLKNDGIVGINEGSIWWQIISIYNKYLRYVLCGYALYNSRTLLLSHKRREIILYKLLYWTTLIGLYCNIIGLPFGYRLFTIGSLCMCYFFAKSIYEYRTKYYMKVFFYMALWIGFILTNAQIVGVSHSVMLGELQLE